MAFTDDLRGLSRAGQIARVQAVALEHGDYLTDREAGEALNLHATQVADDPGTSRYGTIHSYPEPEAG
jgi:hypothetical protein